MDLIQALMERDGITRAEAVREVDLAREMVNDGEDPEEVLYDMGFEPDYIMDLF